MRLNIHKLNKAGVKYVIYAFLVLSKSMAAMFTDIPIWNLQLKLVLCNWNWLVLMWN